MDKSTEYCSFVSVDYIICECGDNFPDEDALRVHLASEHGIVKPEMPESPKEEIVDTQNEESYMDDEQVLHEESVPSVITEIIPNADMEPRIVYFANLQDEDQPQTEYYLDASQIPTMHFMMPEDIKQEDLVVQYMDENGALITNIQEVEEALATGSNEEAQDIKPKLMQTSRKVVFRKEQIQEQVVIIDHENTEHDYDCKEVDTSAMTQYSFCDVCGKSFMSERSLKLHMYRSHGIPSEKKRNKIPYKNKKNSVCEVCGKKYILWQRKCLGCGNQRPPSGQTYTIVNCEVCGVSRCSNAALRYHMRVHTGERPYKCQECSKTFTMPLFLQLHTRTHTGERPYQCSRCPKAFSNQAALLRHDRVHTGVKPYVCPECGKAFTQSNSMKLHYQTVHLKMPAPYKSAARKRRDEQKQQGGMYTMDRSTMRGKVKKNREEDYIIRPDPDMEDKVVYIQQSPRASKNIILATNIVPQEKLLFRHGSKAPHYAFTVAEEVEYEINSEN